MRGTILLASQIEIGGPDLSRPDLSPPAEVRKAQSMLRMEAKIKLRVYILDRGVVQVIDLTQVAGALPQVGSITETPPTDADAVLVEQMHGLPFVDVDGKRRWD